MLCRYGLQVHNKNAEEAKSCAFVFDNSSDNNLSTAARLFGNA